MIAEVIVDISSSDVDKVYDYIAPEGVCPGHRVMVPFGRQRLEGIVLRLKETPDTHHALKAIERILDPEPIILPEFLALAEFMRKKNLRYIDCFRLFMPARLRGGAIKELKRNFIYVTEGLDIETELGRLSVRATAQRALLKELSAGAVRESELIERYSSQAIKALSEKGLIYKKAVRSFRTPGGMNMAAEKPQPTPSQQQVIEAVENGEGVFLLHGVTGSGKTEVYMSVIESALRNGKTAVMLVPEISLTPQMLGLFRARFGDGVAILHSGLSDGHLDEILSFTSEALRRLPLLHVNYRFWNLGVKEGSSTEKCLAQLGNFFGVTCKVPAAGKPMFCRLAERVSVHFDVPFNWPDLHAPLIPGPVFCHGLRRQFAVLADGLVTACCLDRDGTIRLGDANAESLRTILTGGRANAMRRALAKGEASEEICRHCAYRVRHSAL